MRKNLFLFCTALLLACFTSLHAEDAQPTLQLVSVKKIWDAAPHCAFTDLIRFHDKWFCTFRESQGHINGNGQIRVLASADGESWKSTALLSEDGIDLRDPKLSITPDNRLMLVIGGSVYEQKVLKERQPRVAFSNDGETWTSPHRVLEKGEWLWRVTWNNGHAYGLSYASTSEEGGKREWVLHLVQSDDGIDFHRVTTLKIPGRPNEATLRFLENGDAMALVRRESLDLQAWIGTSKAPYTNWTWHPAGMRVGGPNFIILPDGSSIAGGRKYEGAKGAKTFVGFMNAESVTPKLELPSGGDCSYPGMVCHDGLLWVTYYSSHEDKTSIYLAKVKLQK